MRKKFVFATNNSHKLEEVTAILGEKVELLSMKDIKCDTDIPETADTLERNSLLKEDISSITIIWIVLPMIQDWKWKP